MRTAWKVRVATWVRLDHAARGTARFTTETRSAAVRSGLRRRCSTSTRDAPGVPLLAVLGEQDLDLLGGQPPEQLGGGVTLGGIEAHVERLLALEGEPATGLVELVRGQPEVQQHRGRALHSRVRRDRAEVAEAAAHEHHARTEALEAARRAREGFRIAIDTEQAALAPRRLQQLLRVSTHADCPVHHPAPTTGAQEECHFVEKDRYVCVFGFVPAATGSFSFECARLAFGCASPCHCSAFVSLVVCCDPCRLRRIARRPSGPSARAVVERARVLALVVRPAIRPQISK
jgi:hypothetical protein